MITYRVYTRAGTSASRIGERYGSLVGCRWRNSVDRCDSDGGGRLLVECDEQNAKYVEEEFEADDEITMYEQTT